MLNQFAVKISGEKYHFHFQAIEDAVHPWGTGETACYVFKSTTHPKKMLPQGVAYCSKGDIFDLSVGREQALTRALEYFNFSERDLNRIWEAWFDWESEKLTGGIYNNDFAY